MTLTLRRLVSVAATTGLLAMTVLVAPVAASSATQTYVVLYSQSAVPAGAQSAITAAGGTIVAKYDAIGVAIAKSDSSTFRSAVLKDSRVSGVAATAQFAVQNPDAQDNAASDAPAPDSAPATDSDSLSGLQWDMVQIHTPEAHAITGGSPSVVVGDIDTGLDYTHPDLAANVDVAEQRELRRRCAVPGHGRRRTTTTATAPTPPARSPRRPTASASSASRRTSRSPASRPATPTASSSPRRSSARSCGPAAMAST